jgi:hypothetical protein
LIGLAIVGRAALPSSQPDTLDKDKHSNGEFVFDPRADARIARYERNAILL